MRGYKDIGVGREIEKSEHVMGFTINQVSTLLDTSASARTLEVNLRCDDGDVFGSLSDRFALVARQDQQIF